MYVHIPSHNFFNIRLFFTIVILLVSYQLFAQSNQNQPVPEVSFIYGDSILQEYIQKRFNFPPKLWEEKVKGDFIFSVEMANKSSFMYTIEKDVCENCGIQLQDIMFKLIWDTKYLSFLESDESMKVKISTPVDYNKLDPYYYSNITPKINEAPFNPNIWIRSKMAENHADFKPDKLGFVRILVLIDTFGNITKKEIVQSLSHKTDSVALELLKEIPTISPGIAHGKKVNSGLFLNIEFISSNNKLPYLFDTFKNQKIFKKHVQMSQYTKGKIALEKFASKIKLPDSMKWGNDFNSISIEILIDIDGKPIDFQIREDIDKEIRDAIINQLKKLEAFIPAQYFGIPMRDFFYIEINEDGSNVFSPNNYLFY